jgi:hypothetical protein
VEESDNTTIQQVVDELDLKDVESELTSDEISLGRSSLTKVSWLSFTAAECTL